MKQIHMLFKKIFYFFNYTRQTLVFDFISGETVLTRFWPKGLNCALANEKRCKQSSLNIRLLNILEQVLLMIQNQLRNLELVVVQIYMVQIISG